MIEKNFSSADKLLIVVAVLFLIFLFLSIFFSKNIYIEGLKFCCEAALIGGIADWFAVTAFFKKPFGFPYHTAILPKRRVDFVNACVKMVSKEFFTKKRVLLLVKSGIVQDKFINYINNEKTQKYLAEKMFIYLREYICSLDMKKQTAFLTKEITNVIKNVNEEKLLFLLKEKLVRDKKIDEIISVVAFWAKEQIKGSDGFIKIYSLLEEYKSKVLKGSIVNFLLGVAQATSIVDLEEATRLIQNQLLLICDEIQEDSKKREEFVNVLRNGIEEFIESKALVDVFGEIKNKLSSEKIIKGVIEEVFENIKSQLKSENSLILLHEGKSFYVKEEIKKIIRIFIKDFFVKLRENEVMHKEVDLIIYDVVARTALKAQTMVGEVTSTALTKMTDESLNALIYGKVKDDFNWIRINGLIVGSSVGLLIFLVLEIVK